MFQDKTAISKKRRFFGQNFVSCHSGKQVFICYAEIFFFLEYHELQFSENQYYSEAYSKPSLTSKIEHLAKRVNG